MGQMRGADAAGADFGKKPGKLLGIPWRWAPVCEALAAS